MSRLGFKTATANLVVILIAATKVSIAQADACAGVKYPSKPMTLILPASAGNSSDAVARKITQEITKANSNLKFIIDNRPGASGSIGVGAAKGMMEKDPTVLLFSQAPDLTLNPHVPDSGARYESKDFMPISYAGAMSYVLICNKQTGIKSIEDLVARSKSKAIVFAHGGETNVTALAARQLAHSLGVGYNANGINPIPYRGTSQALTDVVGGQVDCMFESVAGALKFVGNEKITFVGKASPEALSVAGLADKKSLTEAQLPQKFAPIKNWMGFYGSPKMDKGLAACLDSMVATVLNDPKVQADLQAQGLKYERKSSEQFQAFFQSEEKRMIEDAKAINSGLAGGRVVTGPAAAAAR
jgi:tripartite-type tricarboxylate transporter receptor subunit TctC